MSRADGRVELAVDKFLYLEPNSFEEQDLLCAQIGALRQDESASVVLNNITLSGKIISTDGTFEYGAHARAQSFTAINGGSYIFEQGSIPGVDVYSGTLSVDGALTENVTWNLPATSGTLALLTDPPSEHASSHAVDGSDPILPESIGAVARSNEGYTITVANTVKTFNANDATIDQLYDVMATLLNTLQTKEII